MLQRAVAQSTEWPLEKASDSEEEVSETSSRDLRRQRGRRLGPLAGQVLRGHRFGVPLWRAAISLLVEVLFCVVLSCASAGATSEAVSGVIITRWIAGLGWTCFLVCLLLRGFVCTLALPGSPKNGLLSAFYMLCSSIQFMVYVALLHAMRGAVSSVTSFPEAFLSRVDGNCTRAYEPPPVCDGIAQSYGSPRACCLVYRHEVHKPDGAAVAVAGDLLSWVAVAVVALAWRDVPFVHVAPANLVFMNTLWLDVLDIMVFGALLENRLAVHPALGIDLETTRSQPKDRSLLGLLWFLWLLAFITALASRGVYAAARFSPYMKPQEDERGLREITGELLRSIRLLDGAKAASLTAEAVRLQSETYHEVEAASGEDLVAVLVDAPPPSATWLEEEDPHDPPRGRSGWARMVRPGEYLVEFADGMHPYNLVLPVERLEPDFEEQLRCFGPGTCNGWGDVASCVLDGYGPDAFNRRSKVLEAMRALVCQEMPFFFARWALEVRVSGLVSLWLVKNLVCMTLNMMTIAACGNEAATCLSALPLRVASVLGGGSARAPGPQGLHHLAADRETRVQGSVYQQDLERLSQHKAWVIFELEKAAEQAEQGAAPAARAPYERELLRLDLEFARVNSQLRAVE